MTALPIIETQAGDVFGVYSYQCDFQLPMVKIFLTSDLFNSGLRPAVNPGISVSRVGFQRLKTKAMKKVAGKLKLEIGTVLTTCKLFAQFASDLDKATQDQLARGQRLRELLKQPQYSPLSVAEQVAIVYAGLNGYLDDIAVDKIVNFAKGLRE